MFKNPGEMIKNIVLKLPEEIKQANVWKPQLCLTRTSRSAFSKAVS